MAGLQLYRGPGLAKVAEAACLVTGYEEGFSSAACCCTPRWRTWERQLRAIGCWAVFFAMLAFYLPVVTAIQALLQVCGMYIFSMCLHSY